MHESGTYVSGKLTLLILQPPLLMHEIQPGDFNTRTGMITATS